MIEAIEALEFLSVPDVLHGRPGDDPRCDKAVAVLFREYQDMGSAPRVEHLSPAKRVCAVLLVYAQKYLTDAGLGAGPKLVEEGLLAMEVGNAAILNPREAGRVLDRFILLVGSQRAQTPLLSSAARLGVSEELKALIQARLGAMA